MIDEKMIDLCAKEGDSFYLYDERIILESINRLKKNFPLIEFLYSIKCNSNPHVLNSVFSQGFGVDGASAREVAMARKAGLPASQIYYCAPGKSIRDIEKTIDEAMIIADSLNEIERIQTVAASLKRVVKIGMRINPHFCHEGDFPMHSKFGIDEDQALEFIKSNHYKNIKVVGIHVHLKSQILNEVALANYYKKMFELSKRFINVLGTLEYVNMGSGMGIQYTPTDHALDMTSLSASISDSLEAFYHSYPDTKLIIEVGRYVVGKSGIYVTRVMDRKVSCGKTYLILKNTLNGFIRPSLEKFVEHYSSDEKPAMWEPFFTCKNAFEFIPLKKSDVMENVTLVGNLCTGIDVIASDISFPKLECGDLLAITNAGSYGAVLSPMQFSSQERPQEFFITTSNDILTNCENEKN